MRNKIVIMLCCIYGLFTASIASAQEGLYVSGNLGISIVNDLTASNPDDQGPFSIETSWDKGYAIHAALGYDFNPVRTELELGYAKNDCDKVDTNEKATDGDVTATTIFANAYTMTFVIVARFSPTLVLV